MFGRVLNTLLPSNQVQVIKLLVEIPENFRVFQQLGSFISWQYRPSNTITNPIINIVAW